MLGLGGLEKLGSGGLRLLGSGGLGSGELESGGVVEGVGVRGVDDPSNPSDPNFPKISYN